MAILSIELLICQFQLSVFLNRLSSNPLATVSWCDRLWPDIHNPDLCFIGHLVNTTFSSDQLVCDEEHP
jgi:hypothetical protein